MKILACPGAKMFVNEMKKHFTNSADEVNATWTRFKIGEVKCQLNESIRGKDIYIVQDVANHHNGSINDNVMEMFVAIDTAKHASPMRITLVIPTFPYSRQHKKNGREGLTAAWICHTLEKMRVQRVITIDIHSLEIMNAFHNTVLENLHPSYQIIKALLPYVDRNNLVVVSPDLGAAHRARFFANVLNVPFAIIHKERDYTKVTTNAHNNNIKSCHILGDIKNKTCLIIDDIIDSGGSILTISELLKTEGAGDIFVGVSLPFFTGDAVDIFEEAYHNKTFQKIIGTDAVYHPDLWARDWFEKASIHKFMSEVIERSHSNESISELLDSRFVIQKLLAEQDDNQDNSFSM